MIDDIQLKDSSGVYYDLYVNSSDYLGQTNISLGLRPRTHSYMSQGTRQLELININSNNQDPIIDVLNSTVNNLRTEVLELRELVRKLIVIRENSNLKVSKAYR
jgi:hypothetical protein